MLNVIGVKSVQTGLASVISTFKFRNTFVALVACSLLVPSLANAAALIYEPFDDLDQQLNGNTPGLGLTNTWSANAYVADSSLTYGTIAYQGGRVVTNPGNQFDKGGVGVGTTLTDAGLMADGATLWFSVLIVKHPDISDTTNDRRTYVSLGTDRPDGFDRIENNGSGFLIAVCKVSNNGVTAQGWNDGSDGGGGAIRGATDLSVADGDTFLAVGKITWGPFGTPGSDVFELYLPDKDLNLGSPVSTLTADFDQLGTSDPAKAFDTIGFAGGRPSNLVPEIDEIRFGATSADVLPLDGAAPVLVTTDNASGSGFQRVATFNEEVYVGAGDIRIVNETTPGTNSIAIGDSQVVVTNNTLTITPTVPLTGGETYHIEIDAGALTDRNLNAFAGISDPDLWEFLVDSTPPTVTSFADNTHPLPILVNTSGRLVYTVTFSEPINAGTVEIADFAATAGSVPIAVDSVTATGPAVFDVAVSTLGTTGTLALEIVASAVITDVNDNPLNTTSAIPSDNTLTVNNPTPNSGSLANDFQETIASQDNVLTSSEARFFHVSVNPDNPGTGWYGADLPGTGDPAPAGWRNYAGPVVAYKMLGNSGNGDVTTTAGAGGEADRITYTTDDPSFNGFGQQQMRLWIDNDPGADLATGAGASATGYANVGNYGYRDWQGAWGYVDVSDLPSGSVHIYYGGYKATPTLKVILHDSDNVGADIVINDAHSVADGGNGDFPNNAEYYVAEIDFVTDGVYDVVEYYWYSSNGRGLGTVLTGPDVVPPPAGTLFMIK